MQELQKLIEGLDQDLTIDDLQPDYNIAPTRPVTVLLDGPAPRAIRAPWGIPIAPGRPPLINARAETLREKPAFREAFHTRRCLIPFGGFYEWERRGRERKPWYYRLREQEQGCFAGLWTMVDARPHTVVVTTEANELIRPVHHRMPAILPARHYQAWLHKAPNPDTLLTLLEPFPASAMLGYPVSTRVNNPHCNDASCILPQTPPPELFPL